VVAIDVKFFVAVTIQAAYFPESNRGNVLEVGDTVEYVPVATVGTFRLKVFVAGVLPSRIHCIVHMASLLRISTQLGQSGLLVPLDKSS